MHWSKSKRRIWVCVQHPALNNSFLGVPQAPSVSSHTHTQRLLVFFSDRTPDPCTAWTGQSDWSQCCRQLPCLGFGKRLNRIAITFAFLL